MNRKSFPGRVLVIFCLISVWLMLVLPTVFGQNFAPNPPAPADPSDREAPPENVTKGSADPSNQGDPSHMGVGPRRSSRAPSHVGVGSSPSTTGNDPPEKSFPSSPPPPPPYKSRTMYTPPTSFAHGSTSEESEQSTYCYAEGGITTCRTTRVYRQSSSCDDYGVCSQDP